jgi:acetoin utilization protein AcuB
MIGGGRGILRTMKTPTLASAMTPFPFSIDAQEDLRAARTMMVEHDLHHLPLTRDGELVGIVSDTDVLLAGNLTREAGAHVSVSAICSAPPYVVDIGERLEAVATTMAEKHIGSALVTRQGKLVGIFTHTDACRLLGELLRKASGSPVDDSVA